MLGKNDKLLMYLPEDAIKNLLCKVGSVLLLASAIIANAASDLPELPDELVLAIRSAIQAHPDVMSVELH